MSTVYVDSTYALLDWAHVDGNSTSILSDNLEFGIPSKSLVIDNFYMSIVHRIHSAALRNLISAHQAVFRIFKCGNFS
jgi:hypothetical protein